MSCNTLSHRSEPCKEGIGGIKGVWFIPFAQDNDIQVDVNNLVTTIEAAGAPAVPITAWYWELKGLSAMEAVINSSRDNGNNHYETSLTLSVKPSAFTAQAGEDDNVMIQALTQGMWQILVWDRNNQIRLLGEENGCDSDGGAKSWGAQVGDARLNTITMKSIEKNPPLMVTGSSQADINGVVVTLAP